MCAQYMFNVYSNVYGMIEWVNKRKHILSKMGEKLSSAEGTWREGGEADTVK